MTLKSIIFYIFQILFLRWLILQGCLLQSLKFIWSFCAAILINRLKFVLHSSFYTHSSTMCAMLCCATLCHCYSPTMLRESWVMHRGKGWEREPEACQDVFLPWLFIYNFISMVNSDLFMPILLRKTNKMTKQEKQIKSQRPEVYSQILLLL